MVADAPADVNELSKNMSSPKEEESEKYSSSESDGEVEEETKQQADVGDLSSSSKLW